jgi:hypothetical protein
MSAEGAVLASNEHEDLSSRGCHSAFAPSLASRRLPAEPLDLPRLCVLDCASALGFERDFPPDASGPCGEEAILSGGMGDALEILPRVSDD